MSVSSGGCSGEASLPGEQHEGYHPAHQDEHWSGTGFENSSVPWRRACQLPLQRSECCVDQDLGPWVPGLAMQACLVQCLACISDRATMAEAHKGPACQQRSDHESVSSNPAAAGHQACPAGTAAAPCWVACRSVAASRVYRQLRNQEYFWAGSHAGRGPVVGQCLAASHPLLHRSCSDGTAAALWSVGHDGLPVAAQHHSHLAALRSARPASQGSAKCASLQ